MRWPAGRVASSRLISEMKDASVRVYHRIDDRELGARIGRKALRPLKLSEDMVRRNGDRDRGEAELGARPAE